MCRSVLSGHAVKVCRCPVFRGDELSMFACSSTSFRFFKYFSLKLRSSLTTFTHNISWIQDGQESWGVFFFLNVQQMIRVRYENAEASWLSHLTDATGTDDYKHTKINTVEERSSFPWRGWTGRVRETTDEGMLREAELHCVHRTGTVRNWLPASFTHTTIRSFTARSASVWGNQHFLVQTEQLCL